MQKNLTQKLARMELDRRATPKTSRARYVYDTSVARPKSGPELRARAGADYVPTPRPLDYGPAPKDEPTTVVATPKALGDPQVKQAANIAWKQAFDLAPDGLRKRAAGKAARTVHEGGTLLEALAAAQTFVDGALAYAAATEGVQQVLPV